MNSETQTNNLDFKPVNLPGSVLASFVAETTITRAIIEGSGGPENMAMTEAGLRFIRYLLSTLGQQACLPNFKDMASIQETARRFIRNYGSPSAALQAMYGSMQGR